MNQGKSVNFSVIKQKIIKTDEVLRMYVETNNKLKSVQETCKAIKLKYDQSALTLSRLQLENERCTFNLENVKLKCELLEKENEKLREQKLTLEDKYNQQTVQSQLHIKELEDQLRMLQEIKTTAEILSPKKKRSLSIINENDKKIKELEDKIKQLEESEANDKNEIKSLNAQNKKLSNDIIITEKKHSDTVKELQSENSNLLEELNKFKCQVNKANSNLEVKSKHEASLENLNKEKDLEISELRKKIFALIVDENKLKIIEEENDILKQKLVKQEKDLVNSKKNNCTKDICLQTDEIKKKHTRSIRLQTVESMKTLPHQEVIVIENRKLKQTILDRDAEIFKLKAKPKISTKHCHSQTEALEYDVDSVEDILVEMCMPFSLLSPLSSCENLNVDDVLSPIPEGVNDSHSVLSDIPDIVITPPTPILEQNFEKFNDFHKTSSISPIDKRGINPIEQLEITNTNNSKNSEILDDKQVKNNSKKVSKRKKYHSSSVRDSDNFIKLRKSCLKRLLNKQYVFKKEMRRVRKLSKQDCILKALRTLKRSNINFTISNESNIPKWCGNYGNYDTSKYPEVPPEVNQQKVITARKISTQKYKNKQYVSEKLNCRSKNCNNGNSCMLLNNVKGVTELLGFFSVKNENITPSSSRMGNIIDNKHLNCLKSLNLTYGSEVTPENLLETLADLVSQKLKEKKFFSKKRRKSVSGKSDSFYSETETEIERLFSTPDSVLRRNKILLKRAKQQNLKESVFMGSLKEDNFSGENKITPSKITHCSEDTQGSETEINSFVLDDASWIENKNASNITKLISANKYMGNSCDSFRFSTCPSETNKKTVKSSFIKLVKASPFKCPESQKEEKAEIYGDDKILTASNVTVFNQSAESYDSIQYSKCPEIISPLSSLIDKDSPGSKNNHISSQTDEKLLKENTKISPSSSTCLQFSSSQDKSDVLNASQSCSNKSLIESPLTSACINRYIYNDKMMSDQISTFINNFKKCNNSIEDHTCTPISRRKLFTSSNKPNKNDCWEIFPKKDSQQKLDMLLFNKNQTTTQEQLPKERDFFRNNFLMERNELNTIATNTVASSESSNHSFNINETIKQINKNSVVQEVNQNISNREQSYVSNKSEESSVTTKSSHVTCLSSPLNMLKFSEECGIFPVQSAAIENITKEILNVLPDVETASTSLPEFSENEHIPSCPQSPVNDYEEHADIKSPVIIPLESLFKQNTTVGLDENSENTSTSYDSSRQEETMEADDVQFKQVIDALPQEENTSNHLTKANEIGTKDIFNILPDAENTSNSFSDYSDIEHISSRPQSPISDCEEHVDIKIPKIIPLKRSCERDITIDLDENNTKNMSISQDFSKQKETMEASETKIISSDNDHNEKVEQVILDELPEKENISSHQLTEEILNVLPDAEKASRSLPEFDEIQHIPSCPQSPVDDYEKHMEMIPKVVPLEKLVKQDTMINLNENNSENSSTSHDFLKQEMMKPSKTKIMSCDNNHNKQVRQVILDALPKKENTSSCLLTKEILNVSPDAKKVLTSLSEFSEIEHILSCPQSPVSNSEEHLDIKIPKIIPLERAFKHDTVTNLDENSPKNIPTSYNFSKQKVTMEAPETEIISCNDRNEQVEQIILDALSKKENISSHLLTKEILSVSPNAEKASLSLSEFNEIEHIPSCPQSPVHDYEEHTNIKNPKIIPLERQFEQEETMEVSETKIMSSGNDRSEQVKHVILDVLPKKENTTNHLLVKEILNVLPDMEKPSKSLSEFDEMEHIPSCPQSPVDDCEEHMDIKNSKIIRLEGQFKQDTIIDLDENRIESLPTYEFSKSEEMIKTSEAKIMSSNNDHNEQFEQVILNGLPKEEGISSHISKENEIENLTSCPVSPIKQQVTTKTMLLENLDEQDIKGDFDKSFNTGDVSLHVMSPESNDEHDKLLSITPLNSKNNNYTLESSSNEKCQTPKCLKTTATDVSPLTLRRSKRICKRISYSKLHNGKNNDSCAIDNVNKQLAVNSKSKGISKISQVDPNGSVESQFSNKSFNEGFRIASERSKQIKRKRGRPRKHPVKNEEIKALAFGNTNCNEEVLHPENSCHEKHFENTVLSIEPQGNISKDKNRDTKELFQEENLFIDLCTEPVEENINSKMYVDESNSELKNIPENISGHVSEENRITNLWEKHELLNDDTDFEEKNAINYVEKEEQNNKKTEVRKRKNTRRLKSSDTLILKKTSNVVSEGNGHADYWETNELHNNLIIDEINDKNNEKVEQLDDKNAIVRESERTHDLSDAVILKKISDIISKEKRDINLWKENESHSNTLIGANAEEISDKNNELQGKLVGRNIVRKRKYMSTLKSNTIKQFKMKRKMFQMDVETVKKTNTCDLNIIPNSNRSNVKKTNINVGAHSKSNMIQGSNISKSTNIGNNETNNHGKRIHIVQNILIPANSCYAVDLMEEKKYTDNKFSLNCDIRLDVTQTSSQNDVKFCNPPLHKKKIAGCTDDINIPNKRKRIVSVKSTDNTNENSDILSKILGEMDRDKPNGTVKSVVTSSIPKQNIASNIEDKEWRDGIIAIAESIYNVATEKEGFKQPIVLCNGPKKKISTKERILMSRLLKLSTEDNIPDEIIVEFKRRTVDNIAELILQRVSQDTTDKPDCKYYPAPLMTKTQRILLGLMVRLEKENIPNVLNTFLSKADTLLFGIGCGIRSIIPITRLYLAVCRLQADINKMRNFCCDAFYFLGDRAIPLLFTVLTSWIEVLPKEPDLKYYPLAKVLVQIVHLRSCITPGYNLLPLRYLLHQYHEYPTERWNCDELFQELFQQFLRNPIKSTALRLLCKNKDMQWTYKKVNEFLKPLVYKIPAENVNFKATVIVLIGNICGQCNPKNESDVASWNDLQWWLNGLLEGEEESCLIEKSVNYSLSKLRKKRKGFKSKGTKLIDKVNNRKEKYKELGTRDNGIKF